MPDSKLSSKGGIGGFVVFVREDFEQDLAWRHEDQKHALEAMRSEQYVDIVEEFIELAGRSAGAVHNDVNVPDVRGK